MALQQNMQFNGLEISNAYIRVARIEVTEKQTMQIAVSISSDAQSSQAIYYLHYYDTPYDLNGSNVFAQGYSYLKSLPEFTSAIDV